MNKTIIELREEAIKEDKNPEFYLYQKLEEKDKEVMRLNNIIDELEKWLKEKQILYGINQQGFSWGVCGEVLDKLKELKEGE